MDEFEPIDANSTASEVRTNKCSQCGSRSETIYQKEPSMVTYVLSFMSLFLFQFWAIFIIPIIVAATQQVTKRCYDCDAVIEKHNLFSLPSMSDQVRIKIQNSFFVRLPVQKSILIRIFGSVAFILSRKYAYGILAIITILFVYNTLTKEEQTILSDDSMSAKHMQLQQTWIDFVKDCGSQVYVGNSVRANSHYIATYHQNNISWEGIYTECVNCPRDFAHMPPNTEYKLAIKMNPTDSAFTDILLSVNYQVNFEFISVVKNIAPLDIIQFTAEFQQLGSERSLHMLSLKSITLTGRKETSLETIPAIQV